MKNDITRNTFNALKHYSRVTHQQGRVPLDADWNEQTDILLHYLRALAEDLIGPHGGPGGNKGFEIITVQKRLSSVMTTLNLNPYEKKRLTELLASKGPLIGPGRYYVDGWICENESLTAFRQQPDNPIAIKDSEGIEKLLGATEPFLLYLDVWERNITWIEDDQIREVALGGPDTTTRLKVVAQVKAKLLSALEPAVNPISCAAVDGVWGQWTLLLQPENRGTLKAEVKPQAKSNDPCVTSPESRYRGAENQLYRVEIHQGGPAWNGKGKSAPDDAATFKWSRENGSVVAAWLDKDDGNNLTVTGIHDQTRGFAPGQWVEMIDDNLELQGSPGKLVQLIKVEGDVLMIDPKAAVNRKEFGRNPKVRRWDQQETEKMKLSNGAIPIIEGSVGLHWFQLEDGIQIQFQPFPPKAPQTYRTGDYWLIPARVATGDIEWPREVDNDGQLKKDTHGNFIPQALSPHGIEHHYAPLAIVQPKPAAPDPLEVLADLRHEIVAQGKC